MKKILIFFILILQTIIFSVDKLNFWTIQLTPTYRNLFNNIIQEYENKNNIDIVWTDIELNYFLDKYYMVKNTQLEPDVINVNTTMLIELSTNNNIISLNKYKQELNIEKYYDGLIFSTTINNNIYQIPWYITPQITIINKDIFNQQGIEITNEQLTWYDIQLYSNLITKNTNYYSIIPNIIGFDILILDGVKILDENNKQIFHKDKNTYKTLSILKEMYQNNELIILDGYLKGQLYFSNQQLQMYPVGISYLNLVIQNKNLINKIDILSPILSFENKVKISPMNLQITNKQNIEESIKFINYLNSEEVQYKFMTQQTILPPNFNSLLEEFYELNKNDINIKALNIQFNYLSNQIDTNIAHNIPLDKYIQIRSIINKYYLNQIIGTYSLTDQMYKQAEEVNFLLEPTK